MSDFAQGAANLSNALYRLAGDLENRERLKTQLELDNAKLNIQTGVANKLQELSSMDYNSVNDWFNGSDPLNSYQSWRKNLKFGASAAATDDLTKQIFEQQFDQIMFQIEPALKKVKDEKTDQKNYQDLLGTTSSLIENGRVNEAYDRLRGMAADGLVDPKIADQVAKQSINQYYLNSVRNYALATGQTTIMDGFIPPEPKLVDQSPQGVERYKNEYKLWSEAVDGVKNLSREELRTLQSDTKNIIAEQKTIRKEAASQNGIVAMNTLWESTKGGTIPFSWSAFQRDIAPTLIESDTLSGTHYYEEATKLYKSLTESGTGDPKKAKDSLTDDLLGRAITMSQQGKSTADIMKMIAPYSAQIGGANTIELKNKILKDVAPDNIYKGYANQIEAMTKNDPIKGGQLLDGLQRIQSQFLGQFSSSGGDFTQRYEAALKTYVDEAKKTNSGDVFQALTKDINSRSFVGEVYRTVRPGSGSTEPALNVWQRKEFVQNSEEAKRAITALNTYSARGYAPTLPNTMAVAQTTVDAYLGPWKSHLSKQGIDISRLEYLPTMGAFGVWANPNSNLAIKTDDGRGVMLIQPIIKNGKVELLFAGRGKDGKSTGFVDAIPLLQALEARQ